MMRRFVRAEGEIRPLLKKTDPSVISATHDPSW